MEECAGFGWRSPLRCRRVPKLETLRRFDDADNRITEVETSADGAIWHTDANYTYYPHGPLARVELGEHKVQGIDYAYTLQGWLKGINGDLLSPTTDMGRDGDLTDAETANDLIGRDAYAMSLGYYGDEDYKAIGPSWGTVTSRPFAPIGTGGTMATEHVPLYNGNIAHTVNTLQPFDGWSTTSGPAQILAMVYRHDQLNRLKQARGVVGLTSANTWHSVNDAVSDRYKSAYWHDANGNLDTLARFDGNGQQYDGFKYAYHTDGTGRKVRNRLYNIREMADQPGTVATDIPHIPYQPDVLTDAQNTGGTINTANLYGYDVLGQRVRDNVRGIEDITWSATGKMKVVDHTTASGKPDVFFSYDAGGTRILKQVGEPALNAADYREHYVHDAQGNIMAIYRYNVPDVEGMPTVSLKLTDRPLYGSSRLGSLRTEEELHSLPSFDPNTADPIQQVDLNYDLTDHLGNVATVVTGRLLDGAGAGSLKQAEVVSATLHEPFGMDLTGMNWQSDVSRFGFQNQLRDVELGFIHFKYREYGADGSGFLTIDPLAAKYPFYSPYAFSGNRVIDAVELEGLEPSGVNLTTGVETTANDTYSEHGQWDTQLVYPNGGPTRSNSGGTPAWLTTIMGDMQGTSPDPTNKERNDGQSGLSYVKQGEAWGPGAFRSSSNVDIQESDGSYLSGGGGAGKAGPAKGAVPWLEALKGPSKASEKGVAMLTNGDSHSVVKAANQNARVQTGMPPLPVNSTTPIAVPPSGPDTMQALQYYEYLHVGGSDRVINVPLGMPYEHYYPHTTSPSKRGK